MENVFQDCRLWDSGHAYAWTHQGRGVLIDLSQEKALFSGDTLFYESVGRTDFPTGSYAQIVKSVERLVKRPCLRIPPYIPDTRCRPILPMRKT